MAAMNVILTGLRGTGKSSIGRRLALVLGRPFFDTDLLSEQQAGEPISRYVERLGWDAFRDLEHRVICQLARQRGAVISSGGGTLTFARNVESRPVIGRSTYERQPQCDIYRVIKGQRLDRNQCLIVIHAQSYVIGTTCPFVEKCISRQGADSVNSFGAQLLDRRSNYCFILFAECTVLARMWIETGDYETRPDNSETPTEIMRGDTAGLCYQFACEP